jgi:hypothetical protein
MDELLTAAEVLLDIIREMDGLGWADQFIEYCAPELGRLTQAVDEYKRGEISA